MSGVARGRSRMDAAAAPAFPAGSPPGSSRPVRSTRGEREPGSVTGSAPGGYAARARGLQSRRWPVPPRHGRSAAQEPLGEQGFDFPTAVGDQVDNDVVSMHPIHEPVRFEKSHKRQLCLTSIAPSERVPLECV